MCKICEDIVSGPKEERITLTQRGIPNMHQAALRRNDSTLFNIGDLFHKRCKHEYTNLKTLKSLERQQSSSSEKTTTKRKLRSEIPTFNPRQQCLFCGIEPDVGSFSVKAQRKASKVRTATKFQITVRDACSKRRDDWGEVVLGRLNAAPDLFAYDAVYHKHCFRMFILCKKTTFRKHP